MCVYIYIYIYVCACVCVYACLCVYTSVSISMCVHVSMYIFISNPSTQTGRNTKSIFLAEFNRFELSVFLLLDRLPYYG